MKYLILRKINILLILLVEKTGKQVKLISEQIIKQIKGN